MEMYSELFDMYLEIVHRFLLALSVTDIIIGSVITAVSVAVLLGLAIFTLIANKHARIFGIFAWIGAIVGMITQWLFVVNCNVVHEQARLFLWQAINFLRFLSIYGEPPYDPQRLTAGLTNPTLIVTLVIASLLPWVFYTCMILMAVYSGRQLKSAKKGFAVAAMILFICHAAMFFVGMISPVFFLWPNSIVQLIWTAIYNGLLILPALLLAVQGIFVIIDNKKKQAEILANTVEISNLEE